MRSRERNGTPAAEGWSSDHEERVNISFLSLGFSSSSLPLLPLSFLHPRLVILPRHLVSSRQLSPRRLDITFERSNGCTAVDKQMAHLWKRMTEYSNTTLVLPRWAYAVPGNCNGCFSRRQIDGAEVNQAQSVESGDAWHSRTAIPVPS